MYKMKNQFDFYNYKNTKEFNRLSEKERVIMEMKFQYGYTYKEIADKLGISAVRVEQLLKAYIKEVERLYKAREYSNVLDIPVEYSMMPVRIRRNAYIAYGYDRSEKDRFTLGELKEVIESGKIYKARNIGKMAVQEAIKIFDEEYSIKLNTPKVNTKIKIELEGVEDAFDLSTIDNILSFLNDIKDNHPEKIKDISIVKSH